MNRILKFKCPECGHDRIEEIMTGVIVSTPICHISHTGETCDVEYDHSNTENFDGQVDRYQCARCGFIVPVKSLRALMATGYMQEVNDSKGKYKK